MSSLGRGRAVGLTLAAAISEICEQRACEGFICALTSGFSSKPGLLQPLHENSSARGLPGRGQRGKRAYGHQRLHSPSGSVPLHQSPRQERLRMRPASTFHWRQGGGNGMLGAEGGRAGICHPEGHNQLRGRGRIPKAWPRVHQWEPWDQGCVPLISHSGSERQWLMVIDYTREGPIGTGFCCTKQRPRLVQSRDLVVEQPSWLCPHLQLYLYLPSRSYDPCGLRDALTPT